MLSGFRVPAMMAALLASWWLSGCAPSSVADLREKPHSKYSFEVPADYATVYERIVLRARQRYVFTGAATLQPGVSAGLFSESQSATVTLWNSGGIGIRYLVRAEIHAVSPARTRVELYAARNSDGPEALLWAGWADTPLDTDTAPRQ
jgi:hypothetical protein